MKRLTAGFFIITVSTAVFGEPTVDISQPQKRTASLDLARTLLTTKPIEINADDIAQKNPFNPVKPLSESEKAAQSQSAQPTAMGEKDILQTLAATVLPSGTMQLGDASILLIGQKKLKVGDRIPIVFQGTTYELQVTSIERTSFSLRLNNAEITRPIKPAVTKP